MSRIALMLLVLAAAQAQARAAAPPPRTFVVNEYFGMVYRQEPVSFDVAFDKPVSAEAIGLDRGAWQVEVLEGTRVAVRSARVWTLVDFEQPGQQAFTVVTGGARPNAPCPISVVDAGQMNGVKLAAISNGRLWAKIPVGSAVFEQGASGFDLPGPVVSVSPDGKTWYGSGYLDTMRRVKAVRCEINAGPVFYQSTVTYECENDRRYVAQVRMYPSKPWVRLVEDFNLGGASRFIFNYDDWAPPYFVGCADQAQTKLREIARDHADDFIVEEGQKCFVRLVVWTQFGYFNGKSETIGLCSESGDMAVGGFYMRPDRWTRAKVNHVDLYSRPEVPGERMTRGVVGLNGARQRIAMEAWLVDGHREWAIYAMPAGTWKDPERKQFEWNPALRKAHVVEGVWPLDRINRLPLVWNADGTPIDIADTAPKGRSPQVDVVLKGLAGRSGLQTFNGSEGNMRASKLPYLRKTIQPAIGKKARDIDTANIMVGPAMWTYMAMDESAYPGRRAMLPWSDPEALNPFYQGMENMNFNADRYRCVAEMGAGLAALNHPEGRRFLEHGREQFSMALDRYVYPESGCWEESHNYMNHSIKNLIPLARTLREFGAGDFFDDIRFARMFEFWCAAHSPRDPGFGNVRVAPPVGDHGLSVGQFNSTFPQAITEFAAAKTPAIQKIARHMAWLMGETGGDAKGVTPEKPNLRSRYLQGYGSVMRATDAAGRESYLVLRACQSWGHHHEDKGSMWFWGRNVHFFGDAAWGAPPGGTYWNRYKQGPAGHTQIEFVGINNWTLPCKYPAPWISDDEYTDVYDYANARCVYPYNPQLDLEKSTPVALRNACDRQVLFVHPDLLIVRDNVETVCPTIWRMHSFQVDGMKVDGPRVVMASPQKVTGRLHMLYPPDVRFAVIDHDDLNVYRDRDGKPLEPRPVNRFGAVGPTGDTRSVVLRWDMPLNASATWTFGVHDEGEAPPQSQLLDADGRVVRVRLADGREVIAMLNIEPFRYTGEGIEFEGTVGLVIRQGGKTAAWPVRAKTLAAK